MGKDEHRHGKGKNFMALTPENQLTDGKDVEFSEEFADHEDKEAMARRRAASKRNKK